MRSAFDVVRLRLMPKVLCYRIRSINRSMQKGTCLNHETPRRLPSNGPVKQLKIVGEKMQACYPCSAIISRHTSLNR
jgi:hypothetical protein